MVNFPNNPTNLQIHAEEGQTWQWRSSPGCWSIFGAGASISTQIATAAGDYTWQIVGDMLVSRGIGDVIAASGSEVITFPTPYGEPPVVVVSMVRAPGTGQPPYDVSLVGGGPTTTTFSVTMRDATGAPVQSEFSWLAFGPAPEAQRLPKEVAVIGGYTSEDHDDTGASSCQIVGQTLECWGTNDGSSPTASITFAKVFDGTPAVTVTPIAPAPEDALASVVSVSSTGVEVAVVDSAGLPVAVSFAWVAKGKWSGV